ncbi:hydrogenase 4 subunit B [Solihabitans fulvus]|uniref:Hydrogenase 4 subunit B n=1 Tax=Solihabitans fulvus TaxID=1892852 RepID=A0A5B2XSL0_9PSEU|nr:proton-conducting transporter membrane subunit [Solihabitans fulvus]KAA2265922.1 hydrogenase 4 subunit B [Solihabitans fulvus]
MSPAGLSFVAALVGLGLAAVAGFALPGAARPAVVGALSAVSGCAALVAGVGALAGQAWSVSLPGVLPLSGLVFAIDPLGGMFVAVTGGVVAAAAVYGVGYTGHGLSGRLPQSVFPVFAAAMLLVPAAATVGALLVCWELMAVASLLLVVTEHRERPEVASAGRWYAVMTHLGFAAILAGLMLFAAAAPGDSFAALRAAAPGMTPGSRTVVFVLVLAGFASKAGIVPLHAWLPRAHPEAPSHVSALMSAAMVNLGIYGIIRVGFDLLGGGARGWWIAVLAVGAVSALYGILQAAVATDLKRLLAHSTTENMGLVLVGVGAAGIFATSGERVLAGLALVAALLHTVNHAAFKTLLFLAAGSVLRATGSRDLDALGGLRARMPATTLLFGVGALAASALPPGTAFVSEWLLLQALVHGLPASGAVTAIAMPLSVAVVALTAGLAVVTFVKAFGTGFLARPRSEAAARAAESPRGMVAGMVLAAGACGVLALAPTVVVSALGRATAIGRLAADPISGNAVTVRLGGVAGALSPLMLAVALLAGVIVVLGALRLLASRRARREARLWDCGAGPPTPRMEYTATSFAEPVQRVFDNVLRPEQDVEVTHADESRYLVAAIEYRRAVPDRVERRLYVPVLTALRAWGRAARGLADGSVHRYLGYGFGAVTVLLIVLAVTR